MKWLLGLILFTGLTFGPTAASATAAADLCLRAIGDAERRAPWLPEGLLHSIGLVESGHRPEGTKRFVPWPWAVNSPAGSFYLRSHGEAVAKVRDLKRQGITNIDVGCMQINLHFHGDQFRSLEEAFRPASNVGYAVRFLGSLRQEDRTLFEIVGRYHSATPKRSEAYASRVFARWGKGSETAGSKHGLGTPDSVRILRPAETTEAVAAEPRRPTGRVWQRVYGQDAPTAGLLPRSSGGWSATPSTATQPTQPRAPGQIAPRQSFQLR